MTYCPSECCPPLLFPPFDYLSTSSLICPSTGVMCCISFAAPPLNIQRLTPLAHPGKNDQSQTPLVPHFSLRYVRSTISSNVCVFKLNHVHTQAFNHTG